MKKTIILIGNFLIVFSTLYSQNTPVSQIVKKKKVLLEEFTGIECLNCPQGHYLTSYIQSVHPNQVVAVNIHSGSFAVPSGNKPDFRTTAGTAIHDWINPYGYPSGSVQRREISGTLNASANDFQSMVNTVLTENSPVNLAMNVAIDTITRVVTAKVEVFYTSPFSSGTLNYLNVGILQNNYKGYQYNPNNYNPSAITSDGQYIHEHMFRGFINTSGVWGDQIDASQTGVITKLYTYTLPASINNIPLYIQNLEFFAFIGQGHNSVSNSNVYTAANTLPTLGRTPNGSISITSGANPSCSGSPITFTANAANAGNAPIYNWKLNGASVGSNSTYTSSTLTSGQTVSCVITSNTSLSTYTSNSITVNVNPAPSSPIVTQNNLTLTSSYSNGNQWNLNGQPISGATNQSYTVIENGNYTVTITNNGCSATSSPLNYNYLGFDEVINNNSNLLITPNPSNGYFKIDFESKDLTICEIEILNTLGEVLFSEEISAINNGKFIKELEIQSLNKGMYFVKLNSNVGEILRKVILE